MHSTLPQHFRSLRPPLPIHASDDDDQARQPRTKASSPRDTEGFTCSRELLAADMRERITFVYPRGTDVDPDDLDVQPAGLVGPSAVSVRQDRLTFGLEELPLELANLLRGHHVVHVRWTSPRKYDTLDPFSSRQSPGLHVSYTPAAPGSNDSSVVPRHGESPHVSADCSPRLKLCEFLQKMGPVDCMGPEVLIP